MSNDLHLSASGEARSVPGPTLFSGLDPAQQQTLRAAGRRRRFADGQMIQLRGDEARGFWLIEVGEVRIGQFDAHGHFNAIAQLRSGDSHGELAMLADRPRVVDALAAGPVEALWIPATALEALLAADPGAARRLIAGLARQVQDMIDVVALIRRSRGADRIAQVLAILAADQPEHCRIAITQQALADLTGTSRMTVSQVLGTLEGQGMIRRGYGAIAVLDLPGLRDLGGAEA